MPRSDFRERPDTRNEDGCGGGEEAALYRLHSGERGCPSACLDSARRERRYFPGHPSHGPARWVFFVVKTLLTVIREEGKHRVPSFLLEN